MTALRLAAQQVLEAWDGGDTEWFKQAYTVMESLRAALAQQDDPTDPGHDVDVLREHVRHLERRVRELHAQQAEPAHEPAYKVKVTGRWHDTEPLAAAFNLPDGEHLLYTTPPQRPAEPVEPVACEPQYANDDGWCDWVCPKPIGYLMQCCGCGLIHEVESRVAKYKPRPSEEFEVVGDPDLQVQWRMKRRDDISPKQKTQEPVAWRFEARHIDTAWVPAVSLKRPGPEHKYMRNVIPLYTTPPQRKPLTEEEIEHIGMTHQSLRQVVRAVEKASWEKNNGQA